MIKLNFTDIWNASVQDEDRPLKERDYEWASSMGKSLIDRYLSMKAVPISNPPNDRARRKFFAGNAWEFIAGLVLYQLGVVIPQQQEVWVEDTPIRVKGKLDYLIGGVPNYNHARDSIKSFPFQKEMTDRFMKTIDVFERWIGNKELYPLVHEIKSCSQYVIEMLNENGNMIGHDLQIYHYLRGLKMEEGHIVYISKDDALMHERVINNPNESLRKKYEDDLLELKGYLDANQRPPKANLIVWEGKFKKNFNIEYSNYLTLIYGFKRPDEYSDLISGKISSWNRVLVRIKMVESGEETKTGKPILLTDKNKIVIQEMEKEGHNPFELAKNLTENIDEDD